MAIRYQVPRSLKFLAFSTLMILASDPVRGYAMGSGKPATGQDTSASVPAGGSCSVNSSDSIPRPSRQVILKAVGTKPFPLPNGSVVDLSRELNAFFLTSVTQTSTLQPEEVPVGSPVDDECATHLEVRAAVTTLEMNLAEFGLTVGYNPDGPHGGVISSLNGKANVKVGVIGMDFSLWECTQGRCRAVAASNSNQTTVTQASLSMTIDFGLVHTGPELIYNTELGKVLRQIMVNGVNQIASSSRIDELPWSAMVRDWMAESGTAIFDAGTRDRLKVGQHFTVYAATSAQSSCGVYKPVAYVRSTQVDAVSTLAVLEQSLDSRGVRPGDIVMIRSTGAAQQ